MMRKRNPAVKKLRADRDMRKLKNQARRTELSRRDAYARRMDKMKWVSKFLKVIVLHPEVKTLEQISALCGYKSIDSFKILLTSMEDSGFITREFKFEILAKGKKEKPSDPAPSSAAVKSQKKRTSQLRADRHLGKLDARTRISEQKRREGQMRRAKKARAVLKALNGIKPAEYARLDFEGIAKRCGFKSAPYFKNFLIWMEGSDFITNERRLAILEKGHKELAD